jgi:GDPmannose 4,6-dehydratase
MWLMLQQDQPDDYVIATNETHTVQEFVEHAFDRVGLDWKDHIKYDARYERPAEVDLLIGDPAKAKKQLNWEPKVRFPELVKIMVDADMASLQGLPVPDPLTSAYR